MPKARKLPIPTEGVRPATGVSEANESSGRVRLIQAAEVEFARNGFEGTSVLAIAERAGVKQPLLNYHFGNKENLWRTVVEGAYAASAEEWIAAAPLLYGTCPLTRLVAMLRVFARISVVHPLAHSLVLREVATGGPRLDWVVETYMKPFHTMLDETITECVRKKLLKPVRREHASLMMTSLLTAVLATFPIAQRLYGVERLDTAQWSEHVEQALDLLLNGMLTDKGKQRAASASCEAPRRRGA